MTNGARVRSADQMENRLAEVLECMLTIHQHTINKPHIKAPQSDGKRDIHVESLILHFQEVAEANDYVSVLYLREAFKEERRSSSVWTC